MAEDFGDVMGAGFVGAAKNAAKAAAKTVGSPVTLAGEAKDMMAASKALEGAGGSPSLARFTEKPDLSR